MSNLEYAIASRKGITLLVGEAGSGKTTVIRAAIAKQPSRVHSVHLNNPTLSRTEFSEMLARAIRPVRQGQNVEDRDADGVGGLAALPSPSRRGDVAGRR